MTPVEVIANKLENGVTWEGLPTISARSIVATLDAAGYVIVPKEPTDKMICAALDDYDSRHGDQSYSQAYRAMIGAV